MNPDEINPYAAPLSTRVIPEVESIADAPSAGGWKRFFNYLIDRFAVVGIFFVAAFILALSDEVGITDQAVSMFENIGPVQDILVTAVVSLLYYSCFEGASGRSLGKWITGTKVVTVTGLPLTWGQVIGRSLARMVPFDALSFLGRADSGWHDSWSGTRVIDLRAAPAPKPRPMSAGNMPRFYQPQPAVQVDSRPPESL